MGFETEFGSGVFEVALFVLIIPIPGAGGETGGVVADEAGGLPAADLGVEMRGKVGTLVDDPGHGVGERW